MIWLWRIELYCCSTHAMYHLHYHMEPASKRPNCSPSSRETKSSYQPAEPAEFAGVPKEHMLGSMHSLELSSLIFRQCETCRRGKYSLPLLGTAEALLSVRNLSLLQFAAVLDLGNSAWHSVGRRVSAGVQVGDLRAHVDKLLR